MSTSVPEDVDGRVNELQQRIDALSSALSASRRSRLMVLVAFLAFVLVSGWGFYSLANMVRSEEYKQRMIVQLQRSMEDNQDSLSREVQQLADGITPVVTAAMSEQSKKDLPLFMKAFDKQREILAAELPEQMTEQVEKRHHDLVAQHEKLILDEFPAAKDEKIRGRVMANVYVALDQLVKKYYADEFKKQFAAMSASWGDFPMADVPSKDDAALNDQLLGELMNLVSVKLASHQAATDTTDTTP